MAAIRIPSPSFLEAFLPVARAQLLPTAAPTRRIPLLQRLRLSPLLPAALAPIPTLLGDLWDGLLKAVPKKKTSHMKKRHRQLASGKHLKDVTALNKCSACGRLKRAHVLCPYCVQSTCRCGTVGVVTRLELTGDPRHTTVDGQRLQIESRVEGSGEARLRSLQRE